jgi:glycogen synthase
MNKKVLMLGWEFPPVINGGLGVACYGISKALSHHVDLTVILPKTDPNFKMDRVQLLGLDQLEAKDLTREKAESSLSYEKLFTSESLSINLDPYFTDQEEVLRKEYAEKVKIGAANETIVEVDENFKLEDFFQIFRNGGLYGHDIIQKVILFAKFVRNLASKREFDIIYAHDWMTFLAGLEVKARTGKPLVLHVHALDYDRSGPDIKGWIYDLEKYAMQQADMVIPVSNYTAGVIEKEYGIPKSKIMVVHNGADHVAPFKIEKSFPDKLILFLGRITGQKGPEFFLELASLVHEKNPKTRFVIAGTGDRLKRLIEAGAYKQISHRFHFTGFLGKEKVHDLLAMADVYCMPSVSEPFGLSALEAAQFGVPMVISKQSGVSEVLPAALKADYWDTETMAEQILTLLNDKKKAQEQAKQNKSEIKNLTWEDAGNKILKAFDLIVDK